MPSFATSRPSYFPVSWCWQEGLALFEFYRMYFGGRSHSLLIGIGLTGFAALILGTHRPDILVPTLLATLIGIISVPLLSRVSLEESLRDSAVTLFGVLYLGLTLGTLSMTRLLPQGEWLIFFLLLVTWASDTGAYYVGTLYGRHRLAPTISPKKTVEGLVGGLFGAIIVAYAARWWFLPELSRSRLSDLGYPADHHRSLGRPDRIGHETQRRHERLRRNTAGPRGHARPSGQSLVHRPRLLLLCHDGEPVTRH